MKRTVLTIACLAAISTPLPAIAENLDHVRQLLSTRQCPQCDLRGSGLVLSNLIGADLRSANLSAANLSRVNLRGAVLDGAVLRATSLVGADLSGASLRGVDLSSADLRGADLTGADLTGAILQNTQFQNVIGLPPTAGNADDFLGWALEEGQRRNYRAAIGNFDQVILRQPDHAEAHLGRGMSRLQLGDRSGGVADIKTASTLFAQAGNVEAQKETDKLLQEIEAASKERRPNNFGQTVLSILGTILQFLL